MIMNRRGFIIGSVAVPAGVALPVGLVEQLALPPPDVSVGTKLIMPSESRGAVMRMSDLRNGNAFLTVVDDDGSVVSTLRAVEVRQSMQTHYVRNVFDSERCEVVIPYGPLELELRFVGAS